MARRPAAILDPSEGAAGEERVMTASGFSLLTGLRAATLHVTRQHFILFGQVEQIRHGLLILPARQPSIPTGAL